MRVSSGWDRPSLSAMYHPPMGSLACMHAARGHVSLSMYCMCRYSSCSGLSGTRLAQGSVGVIRLHKIEQERGRKLMQ